MSKRKLETGNDAPVAPNTFEGSADPSGIKTRPSPEFDRTDRGTLQEAAELAIEFACHLREVREPLPDPQTSVPGDPLQSLSLAGVASADRFVRLNHVVEIALRLWAILRPDLFNQRGAAMRFRDPAVLTLQTSFATIVAGWGWFNHLGSHDLLYQRRFDPVDLPAPLELVERLNRSGKSVLSNLTLEEVEDPGRSNCAVTYERYVTLLEAASIVNKGKGSLENAKKNDPQFPKPSVQGGSGRAAEWKWSVIRPYLERKYSRALPEQFPGDPFRR